MKAGIFKIAACAALTLTAGVASADEDILYWMVDSNATVEKDGVTTSVASFFENYGATEGSAFAARVRVTGGDIQDGQDVFLDLYIPGYGLDEGGGAWGVEFSDAGGYWGAGVPTGNQSPSGDYSAGTSEYSFIVELGNIDSSDNWTTVATSAAATFATINRVQRIIRVVFFFLPVLILGCVIPFRAQRLERAMLGVVADATRAIVQMSTTKRANAISRWRRRVLPTSLTVTTSHSTTSAPR